MNPDAGHATGAVVLWSSIPVAGAGLWLVSAGHVWGFALVIAAIPVAITGAVLKKRYCPRCRKEGCEVKEE